MFPQTTRMMQRVSLTTPFQAQPHSRNQGLRARGRLLVLSAAQVSSNDFKTGMTVEIDGAPFRVVEFLHVKPGKGAAFVRSKLKNYLTGNTMERTFRAGEMVDTATVDRRDMQFTYLEGDEFVFMDMKNYEETRLMREEAWAKYIKEGMDVQVVTWNGKVISVEMPNTVDLIVEETDPGIKGNTASGGSKPAKLETGAVIQVPLFIAQGEKIKVDTRSDSYLGRVND